MDSLRRRLKLHWHMKSQNSPWQPLYTIERDGISELIVSGIIAATVDHDKLFIEAGDADYVLWMRSLLKPFQLASHLQILQQSYPALKPEHYALMCSSHNGEALHLRLLHEIMEIGRLSADQLQCPAAWPGDVSTRENLKSQGQGQQRLYHMCSGKHLSYLLSLQAQGKPSEEYTNFESIEHKRLEQLLSRMLGRSVHSFRKTTDGCQMPNYALSFRETAGLYRRLACASGNIASGQAASSLSPGSKNLNSEEGNGTARGVEDERALCLVGNLMHRYPEILGGSNRLDSKIMQGSDTTSGGTKFLAKDGADGLLAVAMLPTERYKNGLGMVIKLSSGYDIRNMEAIVSQIFRAVGVVHPMLHDATPNAGPHKIRTDHIKTEFAFEINEAVLTAGGIA